MTGIGRAKKNHELRLEWADDKIDLLRRRFHVWREAGGYRVVVSPRPFSGDYDVLLKIREIPDDLSLIVSDALHSLRAALNSLMFELAAAWEFPVPQGVAENLEFPVFGARAMTESEKVRKLGGINPEAAAVIRALQPHVKGEDYVLDPLWQLHELARIDRHRFPHLMLAALSGMSVSGDNLHIVTLNVSTGALTHGEKLGVVRAIRDRYPMTLELVPAPELAFREGPLSQKAVLPALASIRDEIADHVFPTLGGFLLSESPGT